MKAVRFFVEFERGVFRWECGRCECRVSSAVDQWNQFATTMREHARGHEDAMAGKSPTVAHCIVDPGVVTYRGPSCHARGCTKRATFRCRCPSCVDPEREYVACFCDEHVKQPSVVNLPFEAVST